MAGQKPWRIALPLTPRIPAIKLQQPSLALHKYFSLVRASFNHSLIYSNLMDNLAAPEYLFDIEHAFSSSSLAAACSVEPGTAEDVSKIVR